MVLEAGHDEQRVGQPVQVGEHELADGLVAAQAHGFALGPAADGAGHVELGGAGRAARQQEVREVPDDVVELVDEALELLDVPGLDGGDARSARIVGRPAQVRAEVEQLVLDDGELGRSRSHRPAARATPIVEFSSSTVP